MMPRALLASLVLCGAVAAGAVASAPKPLPAVEGVMTVEPRVAGDLAMTDQDGAATKLSELAGAPVLVFFGFTHCPEICPTALADISQIIDTLGPDGEKVNALFVTVDPERDTPAVLKDYLSSFNPRLIGVGGDADALAAVAKAYRVYYKKVPLKDGDYTMDHTAIVYLMDKNGNFVAPFSLKRRPEEAAADLKRYF